MSDLVAWLQAKHDADERTAQEATGERWLVATSDGLHAELLADTARGRPTIVGETRIEYIRQFARHDPQSVLARIEAERMLIVPHRPMGPTYSHRTVWCLRCSSDEAEIKWPCPTLRALAWGYRHRDGYRAEEWAPDGAETTP